MRRGRVVFSILVLIGLLAVAPASVRGQPAEPGGAPPTGSGAVQISGPARVIDGDTIEAVINKRRVGVGLIGIQAPAGNTECGRAASSALQALTRGGLSLAEDPGQTFDDAGRRMYVASTRDGRSVAEMMVRGGLARADGTGPEQERLLEAETSAATA